METEIFNFIYLVVVIIQTIILFVGLLFAYDAYSKYNQRLKGLEKNHVSTVDKLDNVISKTDSVATYVDNSKARPINPTSFEDE
jgi:hypothetical protein